MFLWAFPTYNCTSNANGDSDNCGSGPIIKVDEVAVLLMVLFSWSNGWLNTVIFMKFAENLETEANIDMGSRIMVFMLIGGLMTGGILSTLIGLGV